MRTVWLSLTEHEGGDEGEDEEYLDIDLPPPPPKIQTYKQAIESLEDIMIFLEQHGTSIESYIPSLNWQPAAKQHLIISLIDSFDSSSVLIFRNVYYQ